MPLDLAKLTNVRPTSDGHQAQCPVCAAEGRDQKGKNHLRILRSGKWSCVLHPGSAEHNRGIWVMAGDGATGDYVSLEAPPEPHVTVERTWPVSQLAGLVKDHSYWVGRGIPEEVMEPLQGGVASRGQMKNRYVLPIFNDDGVICGFAGRALWKDAEKRWKNLGDTRLWLWGDTEGVEETGHAILVEGAGCRLACDTRGVRGAIPLWSTHLSEIVLGYLISVNPRRITIALNNDVERVHPKTGVVSRPGQDATAKAVRVLGKFFDEGVVDVCLPGRKDLLDCHWWNDAPDDAAWDEWMGRLHPVPPEPAAATDSI